MTSDNKLREREERMRVVVVLNIGQLGFDCLFMYKLATKFIGCNSIQVLHQAFQIGHLLVELLGAVRAVQSIVWWWWPQIAAANIAIAVV